MSRVQGLWFSRFRILGVRFRVEDLGFRCAGLGFFWNACVAWFNMWVWRLVFGLIWFAFNNDCTFIRFSLHALCMFAFWCFARVRSGSQDALAQYSEPWTAFLRFSFWFLALISAFIGRSIRFVWALLVFALVFPPVHFSYICRERKLHFAIAGLRRVEMSVLACGFWLWASV